MKLFTSHRPKPAPAAGPRLQPLPAREAEPAPPGAGSATKPAEVGGPSGPEPTRYGDWERKGICYDF
ncbi:MAG: succinate dehydrogenase assembly factor 4 [Tistlia sp.]|uniref:DUF1674 domain-containing protein n=1 Tax=Tistlia sp. TaxID=3057121 RepID=UPI0034A18645